MSTTGTDETGQRALASRIRLGSAPDSWGVWFPDAPNQVPWPRFLDELAEAGYEWLELGPHGYLPTDPVLLADEVARRNLRVSGGGVFGALHREDAWERDLSEARKVAALVQAMDAHYLIYLPELYRDLEGRFTDKRELEPDDFARLVRRVSEVGKIVAGDYGVSLVFHPHADSHVGSEDEVGRFLEQTDPAAVSLCLDTGHISYCGGDNLALIEQFPDRIGYVHLKQVDVAVLAQVRAEDLCFAEAVRRGAMCEPPKGIPDMGPLVAALGRLDADIFAIVEQDLYPCEPDVPLPIARRTRHYLGTCGVPTARR
ncbi:MAG TPA: TIM barrel protein [Acidimicrobiales bacterium]|nr:TIM barrel protein [Acidimicrobiales bacterium]